MNLSANFIDWLEQTPEALAKLMEVIKLWQEQQSSVPPRISSQDGPQEFHAGETHELRTIGISEEELSMMHQGYGEAIVKEKAIETIKTFISAIMLMA